MQKIGYVLSGGGARGFAHLGVIKLLEELGIKPYAISGTSAGAIVGALYAAGKSPDEILGLLKNNNLFGWSHIAWQKDGFFSSKMLRKLLKKTIEKDDFDDLNIKLFVTATDLVEGKSVQFSTGSLADAVVASSAVPLLFEPIKIGEMILVDGGVLNNFPIEPLKGCCDIIIGSHVNKIEKELGKKSFFKVINILDRCFHLAIANSAYSKLKDCDLFLEIPLHDFDIYDVKHANEIFETGYKTALLHKTKLQELIGNSISQPG